MADAIGGAIMGGAALLSSPYTGGEWDTRWYSTMSPEQQALYKQLIENAGKKGSAQQASYTAMNPESLSIQGINDVSSSNAAAYFQSVLNSQANKEDYQAKVDAAVREARTAIGDVSTNFAGRGISSSAANRAAGRVETDLGTNIASIISDYMTELNKEKLTAATGLGGLETAYSQQALDIAKANQATSLNAMTTNATLQAQTDQLNAQLGTNYSVAEMQYLLGLVNTQTGENISTQSPTKSLWGDFAGGVAGTVNTITSKLGRLF